MEDDPSAWAPLRMEGQEETPAPSLGPGHCDHMGRELGDEKFSLPTFVTLLNKSIFQK